MMNQKVAVVTGTQVACMKLPLSWQEMDFLLLQQCVN